MDCTHEHATVTRNYTLSITHTPGAKPTERRAPAPEVGYACPDCGDRGSSTHPDSLPAWVTRRLPDLPT